MKRKSIFAVVGAGARGAYASVRRLRHIVKCNASRLSGALLVFLTLSALGLSTVEAGGRYFYDALGRISTVINANGSVIEYQYDANGNATTINRNNSSALSVISFMPAVASIGSTVTIYGVGFNPVPAQNAVTISNVPAPVTAATLTSLTVTVPPGALTGSIKVTVAGVTTTSSQFLTVRAPIITGFSPAFAYAGDLITLSGANLNLIPGGTTFQVGTAAVTANSLTNTQATFNAPSLSGLIKINTSYGQTTSVTPLTVLPLSFPVSPASIVDLAVLTQSAAPTSINVNVPNKSGLLQFDATQGQYLSVQLSSLITVPNGSVVGYQVISPTNAIIASGSVSATSPSIHLPLIPVTGTYFVRLTSGTTTFQATAELQVDALIVADSASLAVATTIPTQTTRFVFSATAGENLGLGISNLVKANSGGYTHVDVGIYRPDGSLWMGNMCVPSSGGCDFNLTNAPITGVYSVVVQSPNPASEPTMTMSFTATLSRDLVVAPTINTATTVNVSRRGQNGRITFAGTAGGAVAVQIGGVTTVPASAYVNYKVLDPNGITLTSTSTQSGYTFNLANLPATGTYTIFVDPNYGATANQKAKAIPSSSATVAVNGASSTINTTALPGSYAYFSFTATAGENLGLGISNIVKTNSGGYTHVDVRVYKPDGSFWVWNMCVPSNGGCDLNLTNVPLTGVYGVVVQSPNDASEPTMMMTFTATVSRDLVVAPTVGTATTVNVSRRGQNGRVTFAGTAGGAMALQIGGITTVPVGATVSYTVLRPDGSTLTSTSTPSGYTFNLANLPDTGTYTLFVNPPYGVTANQKVKVIGSAAVAVNGASGSFNTTSLPGSYAYFNFTATAGENLGLGISNIVKTNSGGYTHVDVRIYKPDGSFWVINMCVPSNGGCDFNLTNVPVTGVYGVVVQSPNDASEPIMTMSFTATVSRELIVAPTVNTATTVNVSRRGQNGRVTFAGTAGGAVAVQIGGITTVPAGGIVSYTVLKPNGSTLTSTSTPSGYTFNLANLPDTGTYTLFVDPQYGASANQKVKVIPSTSAAVAVNGASGNFNTTSLPGSYAYFSFTATAGENLGLGISNIVKTNSGGYTHVDVRIYKPDGSFWVWNMCVPSNGGCDFNLTNVPLTGVYGVVVQSPNDASEPTMTMTFTATVSRDLVIAPVVNTATTVNVSRRGQNGRVTFPGTAGGAVVIQVGGITTVPAGTTVTLTVLKPDGNALTSTSTPSGYTFNLANLPDTGTYTLFVDPQYGATANSQVTRQ